MIRVLALRAPADIERELKQIHVDRVGIGIMSDKMRHFVVRIDSLNVPAANILKQEFLSVGGDAALHKGACDFSVRETPCLLMGTEQQYKRVIKKLAAQPFGLKKTGRELCAALDRFLSVPAPMVFGRFTLEFSRPIIMGIMNVTPDSFSGDGLFLKNGEILPRAKSMVENGAEILDIGGESTRPGARPVPVEEERKRVIPAIRKIAGKVRVPISVDTTKAEIAKEALECGAHIINDVSGLTRDPGMAAVARETRAPVVVMHPGLNHLPGSDPMSEICDFFSERIQSLEKSGIAREKIILDPGIGFGKTAEQNFEILGRMGELKAFGRPLLLGASRKSFIGRASGEGEGRRIPGTAASLALGLRQGFHIFRVHDVREAKQALSVAAAILNVKQASRGGGP